MESLHDVNLEETETALYPDAPVNTNTNASGKVIPQNRSDITKSRKPKGGDTKTEVDRKKGGIERKGGDEERKEGRGEENLTKAGSSLEISSGTNAMERAESVKNQDGVTESDSGGDSLDQRGMHRVKNINMGEIPLRPVGLSLSGSGMQLFVKMDNFLHKSQLAKLENQFVAKMCKARVPSAQKVSKGRKKGARKQLSTGTCSTDRPNPDDSGVCVQPDEASVDMPASGDHPTNGGYPTPSSNPCDIPTVDLEVDGGPESRTTATDGQAFDCDAIIKEEVLGDDSEESDYSEAVDEEDRSFGLSPKGRRYSDVRTGSAPRGHDEGTGEHGQPRQSQTKPTSKRAGMKYVRKPCRKRQDETRKQDIQNPVATDWTVVKPRPVVPIAYAQHKRPVPPVFTSSDLPLKRPSTIGSCSSASILLHQQRNNSSFFSPLKPVGAGRNRVYLTATLNSTSASGLPAHNPKSAANLSRDKFFSEKDTMSVDHYLTDGESSKYALIDNVGPQSFLLSGQDTSSTFINPDHGAPGEQPNHELPTDRQGDEEEEMVSVTPLPYPDFDPAEVLASGVVDAETLAKFTEYTRSMRRDLKQNYKRLSDLMKSFNQQVQEQARLQAGMASGGMDDPDLRDDPSNSSEGRNGCLIM